MKALKSKSETIEATYVHAHNSSSLLSNPQENAMGVRLCNFSRAISKHTYIASLVIFNIIIAEI